MIRMMTTMRNEDDDDRGMIARQGSGVHSSVPPPPALGFIYLNSNRMLGIAACPRKTFCLINFSNLQVQYFNGRLVSATLRKD